MTFDELKAAWPGLRMDTDVPTEYHRHYEVHVYADTPRRVLLSDQHLSLLLGMLRVGCGQDTPESDGWKYFPPGGDDEGPHTYQWIDDVGEWVQVKTTNRGLLNRAMGWLVGFTKAPPETGSKK